MRDHIFTQHRDRWLNRVQNAELKAKVAEDGIHAVINYIEDEDLDETIHEKLMAIIEDLVELD